MESDASSAWATSLSACTFTWAACSYSALFVLVTFVASLAIAMASDVSSALATSPSTWTSTWAACLYSAFVLVTFVASTAWLSMNCAASSLPFSAVSTTSVAFICFSWNDGLLGHDSSLSLSTLFLALLAIALSSITISFFNANRVLLA